jgi:lipopolysaccharide/colanic/teichoic acid biosynthesis glycosyltransferase
MSANPEKIDLDELEALDNLENLPPALRSREARFAALSRRVRLRIKLALIDFGPYVRRAIDVIVTGLGLIAITPILALAAAAIKLTSKGPVLFRQERIGYQGRRFTLFKLRTMHINAEAQKKLLEMQMASALDGGVRFKMARDPRVTRVGRFLRKYSVDELPQLWNVFRGDMTLIGPRPAIWREVAVYDALALRRLEVRPGLTCLWQVGGRSELSFEQQVQLDLEYIDRSEPKDELAILVKTIPAVISGRGAY